MPYNQKGLLGRVFNKSQNTFQNPARLAAADLCASYLTRGWQRTIQDYNSHGINTGRSQPLAQLTDPLEDKQSLTRTSEGF